MKKIISSVALFLFIFSLLLLSACSDTFANDYAFNGDARINPMVGEWNCDESPLEFPDSYTGYLVLRIEKDGEFSLYDAEAGNPGICGVIEITSDTQLILHCDEDDFDPPATWDNMSKNQQVDYNVISENEMQLIFTDSDSTSTLVFTRESSEE